MIIEVLYNQDVENIIKTKDGLKKYMAIKLTMAKKNSVDSIIEF